MRRRVFAALATALALSAAAAAEAPAWQASVRNPDWGGLLAWPQGGLLAWGSDARLWRREAGGWHDGHAPHSGTVRRAVVLDGQTLLAAGSGGLLLASADGGRRWQADPGASASTLADLDARDGTALAVGEGGTVLRRRTGEPHWTPLASPAATLARVRAAGGGRWWLADDGRRVWQAEADGDRWQPLPPAPATIDTLTDDGGRPLLALADGRLLTLAAGGPVRWQAVHRAPRGSYLRIAALGPADTTVATGTLGACAWRPAPAARWQDCSVPARRIVRRVVVHPADGSWWAVGENGLLLTRRHAGDRWRDAAPPAARGRHLEDIAWDGERRRFVAVGAGGLILVQAEGGVWQVEHEGVPHYVHALIEAPGGGLLAAQSHRTLGRSADGGAGWRHHRFEQLHEPAYLFWLHADPVHGSVVVGGGQGAMLVAPDGRHWHHTSRGHGSDHLGGVAHALVPIVVLHGSGGEVLRVHGPSAQWQRVRLPRPHALFASAAHPQGRLFLFGDAGTVLHSEDAGEHWAVAPVPGDPALRVAAVAPGGGALLTAGAGGVIHRAELDADARPGPWSAVALPVSARWHFLVRSASGALWLGGSEGRLLRSEDGGQHWSPVDTGGTATLRTPTHDPTRQRWWMPTREGGLLRSDDDGRHWHAVPTGTREPLKGVWVDPESGHPLLFGARVVQLSPAAAP